MSPSPLTRHLDRGRARPARQVVADPGVAIRARVPLAVLADTIQPFPTFSEAFHFALAELPSRVPAHAR